MEIENGYVERLSRRAAARRTGRVKTHIYDCCFK